VITLSRTGGLRPPRFDEALEIEDDGMFNMWRSVSMASALPAPIGRFRGCLSDAERDALREAGRRAAQEGSQTRVVEPDSPVDQIAVDGATATLGVDDPGEGAWQTLAALLRPLLRDLTRSPVAAIALHVDGGATLVHEGVSPLRLDVSSLAVRAMLWRNSQSEGRWSAPPLGLGEVVAEPGWQLSLPFDHGFTLHPGDRLIVTVTFRAQDGERSVPVSLQSQH
jgi:hypothetical protein